jgi:small GTP-binding protein
MQTTYRIVVMGAGAVGKSAMTTQFVHHTFLEDYDPTIEDAYEKKVALHEGGEVVTLSILDTAGQDEYSVMREQYMTQGDAFVLVYAINSASSFEELTDFHERIVAIKESEDVPLVVVGNKCDLPARQRRVSSASAKAVANSWGATFFEASARTTLNVQEAFLEAARLAHARAAPLLLEKKNKKDKASSKKKHCLIL